MLKYIIKRLLITIPIIVCVAILIYTILYLTPGDPAEMILGSTATTEEIESFREYLGLDRPYIVQLGDYLYDLFIRWDLGVSWIYRTDILYEIGNRLPRTFAISMYSILMGAVCGIPLGVVAAVKQNSIADKIVLFISSVMHCVPGYVIAMVLIVIFSLHLGWLPSYGIGSIKHYILPCACILITSFAGLARSMRRVICSVLYFRYRRMAVIQGAEKI